MQALIVIDVQRDFCEGGALAVPGGSEVVAPINALMAEAGAVVLTQDWHPAGHSSFASQHEGKSPLETVEMPYGTQVLWPDHCVQGTQGADFHDGLDTARAEMIVRKGFRPGIDSYSAFFENDHETPTGLARLPPRARHRGSDLRRPRLRLLRRLVRPRRREARLPRDRARGPLPRHRRGRLEGRRARPHAGGGRHTRRLTGCRGPVFAV